MPNVAIQSPSQEMCLYPEPKSPKVQVTNQFINLESTRVYPTLTSRVWHIQCPSQERSLQVIMCQSLEAWGHHTQVTLEMSQLNSCTSYQRCDLTMKMVACVLVGHDHYDLDEVTFEFLISCPNHHHQVLLDLLMLSLSSVCPLVMLDWVIFRLKTQMLCPSHPDSVLSQAPKIMCKPGGSSSEHQGCVQVTAKVQRFSLDRLDQAEQIISKSYLDPSGHIQVMQLKSERQRSHFCQFNLWKPVKKEKQLMRS